MEIVRRVYFRKRYEGLYQLVRSNNKYYWLYIAGTMEWIFIAAPLSNLRRTTLMEIIRKVFCETSYEGLFRLIKNHKYEWFYVDGTTGDNVNIDELDYPILNVEKGRKSRYPRPNFGTYSLPCLFYFEPQDLEDGNSLGG